MRLQFKVTFKNGSKTVAEIVGRDGGVDASSLTIGNVVEDVCKTEQFLEKLTGLRCHIEQIS